MEPRQISGEIGSRCRVILGKTGSEYLLITNHDDGETEWQSREHRGIPSRLKSLMKNCSGKGRYITDVDFGPTGAWFVSGERRDGSMSHCWRGRSNIISSTRGENGKKMFALGRRNGSQSLVSISASNECHYENIDTELANRIDQLQENYKTIKFVRLFDEGAYFISDEDGTEWKGVEGPLDDELSNALGDVHDCAMAGDGTWVVIRGNDFQCSEGVSGTLSAAIQSFYDDQTQVQERRKEEIRKFRLEQQIPAEERSIREGEERQERKILELERRAAQSVERGRLEQERKATEKTVREAYEKLLEACQAEAKSIMELEDQMIERRMALEKSSSMLPQNLRDRLNSQCNFRTTAPTMTGLRPKCVVCLQLEADIAIDPCGHMCLCEECAHHLIDCPLCRGPVDNALKIYAPS